MLKLCAIGVVSVKSTGGLYQREEIAGLVGQVDEIVEDGVFLRFF